MDCSKQLSIFHLYFFFLLVFQCFLINATHTAFVAKKKKIDRETLLKLIVIDIKTEGRTLAVLIALGAEADWFFFPVGRKEEKGLLVSNSGSNSVRVFLLLR